jgi:hypothetical protein
MEPVDGVAPVDHSRADDERVVGRFGGQRTKPRRDHRGGVATEHAAPVDIARVAHVPADRVRRDPEPIVVVLDRDHPRLAVPSHLAVPARGEGGDGGVDQELDGVVAFGGVGEVPNGQVAGELAGGEGAVNGWHGVSFIRRVERGTRPPSR